MGDGNKIGIVHRRYGTAACTSIIIAMPMFGGGGGVVCLLASYILATSNIMTINTPRRRQLEKAIIHNQPTNQL